MLVFNQVRGMDSSGVAAVPKHGNDVKFFKDTGPATDLFYDKRFDRVFHGFHKALFAHNRSATNGAVTSRNAHPFVLEHIIGMHNGTLHGAWRMDLKRSDDFGTDSEALLWNIQEYGAKEVISKIEGAWALVWYDTRDGTMNLLRNKERQLYYLFDKDHHTVYFNSELDLIYAAIRRDGRNIEYDKAHILNEDTWMSWKIPPPGAAFEEPKREKIEGFKYVPKYKAPEVATSGRFFPRVTPGSNGTQKTQTPWKDGTRVSALLEPETASNKLPRPSLAPAVGPFAGLVGYYQDPGDRLRVYRDAKAASWLTARWAEDTIVGVDTGSWNMLWSKFAPNWLPFNTLDITTGGSHQFKHIGKKKKKRIYYKGWKDHLLDQADFDAHMAYGCCGCTRVPEWGNRVEFLDEKHNFLCEYCSMDEAMVHQWKECSK